MDVFAGPGVIFLQIVRDGHPLAKGALDGVIGGVEGVGGGSRGEKSGVAGEKMFEAEVSNEMAFGGGEPGIVFGAVTRELERMGLAGPFQRAGVEAPEVPTGGDEVSAIGMDVLRGESGDFGGAVGLLAKIPFGERSFRRIDGLDEKLGEGRAGFGERNSGEKASELRDERNRGEVAGPDAEIGAVGHGKPAFKIIRM